MTKRKHLSRRSFLRGSVAGLGLSLALPALEGMFKSSGAYADGEGDEAWFASFFWGGGLPWHAGHGAAQAGNPDLWTPTTTGAGYTPSTLLAPLAGHSVNVATGLTPITSIPPTPGGQGDGHMRGFMVAMTGDRPRSDGFDHPSHTLTALRPSMDQLIAKHPDFYNIAPRFKSLQVGVSDARFHDYGHWNAVSYNGPDSLNPPIMQPTQLFDLLFDLPADVGELGHRSQALDAVLEDANRLKKRLGEADKQRLDSHLQHIFEVQRRLVTAGAVCEKPLRPNDSGNLHQKTSVMAELLALAVSCGQTRVLSFMLSSPATTHIFDNLSVPDGMHKTVHDGGWESTRDITLYQMEAFALFLDEFAAIDHPVEGTLLDRGVVYGTSEYGEGYKHSVYELPVVIAGGGCGTLNSGVHVRESMGNISKAQLTALQALGLPFTSFGFNGGETSDVLSGILT